VGYIEPGLAAPIALKLYLCSNCMIDCPFQYALRSLAEPRALKTEPILLATSRRAFDSKSHVSSTKQYWKHLAGVRKVWAVSCQPNGLSRSRGSSARPLRGTSSNNYHPCKAFTIWRSKTLLAAGRPLRRGELTNDYFNDVRSSGSVYDRISLVTHSAAYGSRPLQKAVARPTCELNET
jgi:hypothetical protein